MRADILLIARTTQLAKYPHVLFAKPSNKVYILNGSQKTKMSALELTQKCQKVEKSFSFHSDFEEEHFIHYFSLFSGCYSQAHSRIILACRLIIC